MIAAGFVCFITPHAGSGLVGLIGFVVTFTIYMGNFENKLIYYVVRPLLNKHYDAQVRDKRIV